MNKLCTGICFYYDYKLCDEEKEEKKFIHETGTYAIWF